MPAGDRAKRRWDVREYKRDGNINTAEYWNAAWKRYPNGGTKKAGVRARVAEMIEGLPEAHVYEFGFGAVHLAELIGKDRWVGFDHAASAVKNATDAGFKASVKSCRESPGFLRSYLVALEVLEHLDLDELTTFLDKSKNTPHAFFSVPDLPDEDFAQHVRTWESADDFESFLRQWWAYVTVEKVDNYWLAHCTKIAPPREPILTVGCSTLLDFQGFLYTAGSWMAHHGTFDGRVEYLIADNHPEPKGGDKPIPDDYTGRRDYKCAEDLREVWDMERVATSEGVRYIRWADKQGTYPGKNQLKVQAKGKWVLTMDSHVMLTPGTIERCLEVIEENPDSDDMFQFPCKFRTGSGVPVSTDFRKQDFIYRNKPGPKQFGVYGWTGNAKTPGDPYPIAAMITSCYLVRRDAWFSGHGYDPILGHYGGWEGPLQLKWYLLGRQVRAMRYRRQEDIDRYDYLYHWHHFCKPMTRLANQTGRVHKAWAKMRNFAASSAVIGGESWVKRHCELKAWDFNNQHIQEGMAEGLKLRPWMIENLARPEWEDITEFFRWMRDDAQIPGALTGW